MSLILDTGMMEALPIVAAATWQNATTALQIFRENWLLAL